MKPHTVMKRYCTCQSLIAAFLMLPAFCTYTAAHPHVFVNTHLNIAFDDNGQILSVTQDWHFDPIFSSSVLVDFAKKNRRTLNHDEITKLTETIKNSVANFDYFQSITQDGKKIAMTQPQLFTLEMKDILKVHLKNKPTQPITLQKGHHYSVTVFDPTYFVNFQFRTNKDVSFSHLPNYCRSHIVRPDVDKVLSNNMAAMSEEFFNDSEKASSLAAQLATRIEISC